MNRPLTYLLLLSVLVTMSPLPSDAMVCRQPLSPSESVSAFPPDSLEYSGLKSCRNDPVNNSDPEGLDVYLVYREFADDILKKAYNDAGAIGVGHFYLVFDDKNVDKEAWGRLVEKLGGQKEGKPILRNANPAYESFSFHPRQVLEEQLGIKEHKDSIGGTLYTTSSFIGYNDAGDVRPFLKQRDKGTNKDAAEAKIFKLATTQEQQFDIYRKVQGLRTRINVKNENVCGTYKVLINNCGTWAVNMVKSQGIEIPEGVRKLNLGGGGIGGVQDYLPFTYMLTGGAAAYGYTDRFVEKTTGGNIAIMSTGLESERGGSIGIGIKWKLP